MILHCLKICAHGHLCPNRLPKEPVLKEDSHAHIPYNTVQNSPTYAGELATLDENIGKIVNHLKAKKLTKYPKDYLR